MAENSPERPKIQTRRSTTSVFTLTPGEAQELQENLCDNPPQAFDQDVYPGGKVAFTNVVEEEKGSPGKKKKRSRKKKKQDKKLDKTELKYFRELSNVAATSPDSLPEAPVYSAPREGTPDRKIDSPNWAISSHKAPGYRSPQIETTIEKGQAGWAVTGLNHTESHLGEDDLFKQPTSEPIDKQRPVVRRRNTTVSVISLSPKNEAEDLQSKVSTKQEEIRDNVSSKSEAAVSGKKHNGTASTEASKNGASALPTSAEVKTDAEPSESRTETAAEENNDEVSKGTPCAPICARKFRKPGGPFPAIWGGVKATPGKIKETVMERKWLFAVIIGLFLLAMFVILFPISFVYVPYYEIALLRTITTGKIHREQTYYPGCYVKGPNAEFVFSQQSAHIVSLTLSVFTYERLELDVDISYSYFIRPEELGQLDAKYGQNYDAVFENIATTTVKNEFIRFTLNDLLRDRARVEKELHLILFQKLGGTCCLRCCVKEGCVGTYLNHLCTNCDASSNCDPGFHVEVKYFQLGAVDIPSSIANTLLRNIVLNEQTEAASLQKQAELVKLETERQVKLVTNEAQEIDAAAAAISARIVSFANADSDVITQEATFTGWEKMANTLSITSQDHKLSLQLINKLSKMDNLVLSNGYNSSTRFHDKP